MEKYDISGVEIANIPLLWEQVAPLIEQALEYAEGEYLVQDIHKLLMYGKMQLWIAADTDLQGIVVTEFITFPQKTVGHMVLIAGENLDNWDHVFDLIEKWMYEEGADLVRAYARPGFTTRAIAHGYDFTYQIYSKPLRIPVNEIH